MPDESCRCCGTELIGYSQCSECRRPIQKICTKCGRKSAEQFHDHCFYFI